MQCVMLRVCYFFNKFSYFSTSVHLTVKVQGKAMYTLNIQLPFQQKLQIAMFIDSIRYCEVCVVAVFYGSCK